MPKRVLAARNQDENEPSSSATVAKRSSSKRVKTDDKKEEKENRPEQKSKSKEKPSESQPLHKEYTTVEVSKTESLVLSKTAFYWSDKYLKNLRHVNPDFYDMYIHNDFSCYGELEIVENCVVDLAKAIFFVHEKTKEPERVNYVLAFRRLEALTILLEHADSLSGIDDGERFYAFMRVVGACYVTILRGLLPKEMFQILTQVDRDLQKKLEKIEKKLPNFAQVLEKAIVIGDMFLHIGDTFSSYTNVLRIVYTNWVFLVKNETIDLNGSAPKNKEDLWKALQRALDIEEEGIVEGDDESFNFLDELKNYREDQGKIGGDSHDLRKWSKAERAAYSLDRFNDSDEFDGIFLF